MNKSPSAEKVSIIVPVFNGENFIADCLTSIIESDIPVPYELIVVDDGSTDKTPEIVKNLPCQYERIDNSGVAAARNRGIHKATGNILFFFDADISLEKETIKTFLKHFKEDKDTFIIQGWYGKTPHHSFWSCFFILRYTFNTNSILNGKHRASVANLETGCMAVRKEVFDEFGELDVSYKSSGGEEHELGLRVMNRFKIYYYSDIFVGHVYGDIWPTLKKIFRRTINFSLLFFNAKHQENFMELHELSVPFRDKLSMVLVLFMLINITVFAFDPELAIFTFSILFLTYFINIRRFIAFLATRKNFLFATQGIGADFLIMIPRLLGVVFAYTAFYVLRQKNLKI